MATNSASPALASQAENARRIRGEAEKLVAFSSKVQSASARNKDSIIPSRHSRADRRWTRWNARPASPKKKAVEKVNCVGVIRQLRTLTASF